MIMIFQLSDWFPKPMIWAIIIKFDQIRKNWSMANFLCWNFGGRKKFVRGVVGKENVTMKSRELLENLLKQLFFEDLPDMSR